MLASPTPADSSPTTANSSAPRFDETARPTQGVFEAPSGLVLSAIARNRLIIAVFSVVVALLAAAYGHTRPRTYTASTTLQVGQVNPNSPGFYSYVESAAALATAFSRAITAEPVLAAVQHSLKLSPATAASRLSAEPLPLSPAFRIIATGPTEASAVALANVTSRAIVTYVSESNSANPEAESLLQEYHNASLQLQQATTNLEHLAYTHRTPAKAEPSFSGVLAPAKAEKETALARLAAIRAAYTAAVSSQAPRSGLVSLIAGASTASSDRRSKVEVLGFIGLLAGLVIGCIVAVLREQRRRRRLSASEIQVETPLQKPREAPRFSETV
jgi:capsular polysaccharide biosynthesis protein